MRKPKYFTLECDNNKIEIVSNFGEVLDYCVFDNDFNMIYSFNEGTLKVFFAIEWDKKTLVQIFNLLKHDNDFLKQYNIMKERGITNA